MLGVAKIFAQTFRLQTQTGQRGLGIVSESREKLFHLSVPLLLATCIVKKRQASADQRHYQNAAFPQQHPVMTMKVSPALEIQPIQQVELAQTEHHPPAGQSHRKDDPESDEGDDNSIALGFSAQMVLLIPSPPWERESSQNSTAARIAPRALSSSSSV